MLTTIHLNIWLGIHLTRLSTERLGPRHGEVRRAHQMLNAALSARTRWGSLSAPPDPLAAIKEPKVLSDAFSRAQMQRKVDLKDLGLLLGPACCRFARLTLVTSTLHSWFSLWQDVSSEI